MREHPAMLPAPTPTRNQWRRRRAERRWLDRPKGAMLGSFDGNWPWRPFVADATSPRLIVLPEFELTTSAPLSLEPQRPVSNSVKASVFLAALLRARMR